jgi:hypothetical protein
MCDCVASLDVPRSGNAGAGWEPWPIGRGGPGVGGSRSTVRDGVAGWGSGVISSRKCVGWADGGAGMKVGHESGLGADTRMKRDIGLGAGAS